MTTQPEALRLADAFDCVTDDGWGDCTPCRTAVELRRLHEAHDWQYRMAGERLRRVEKLEAQRDALLEALKYHQEQTRPIQKTIDAIKAAEEGK